MEKARRVGLEIHPPVEDLDALFDNAERLGVECKGDLTLRLFLSSCRSRVAAAPNMEEGTKKIVDLKDSLNGGDGPMSSWDPPGNCDALRLRKGEKERPDQAPLFSGNA